MFLGCLWLSQLSLVTLLALSNKKSAHSKSEVLFLCEKQIDTWNLLGFFFPPSPNPHSLGNTSGVVKVRIFPNLTLKGYDRMKESIRSTLTGPWIRGSFPQSSGTEPFLQKQVAAVLLMGTALPLVTFKWHKIFEKLFLVWWLFLLLNLVFRQRITHELF